MTDLVQHTDPLPIEQLAATLEEHLHSAFGRTIRVGTLGAYDVQRITHDPGHDPLVHVTGDSVLIGPWGDGDGCASCLALRWQRLRTRSEREALEHNRIPQPIGQWPLPTAFLLDAVAGQVHLLDVHRPAPSPWADGWQTPADLQLRQVSVIEIETLAVSTYSLLPEPRCTHCSPEGSVESAMQGPRLQPRPKSDPNAVRGRSLSDFRLPHAALANPVCGVLGTRTWLNVLSPTTAPVAGSTFMRGYAGLVDVTWSGQGSGYDSSRLLAYTEGLERYAGTHQRHAGAVVHASYDEVRDEAIHPLSCGDYDDQTYREESLLEPFDPHAVIPWVWGRSLRDDRAVLVPSRLVYYSAGVAADNFVFECSNGCATGSSLEEATLFGLLELLERDAFLLGWYGGATPPALDLDSVDSTAIRAMRAKAEQLGYDLLAFDSRVDIDVPVVTSVAVRRDGGAGAVSFAAGAGLDPLSAIEGAFSESLTYLPHLGSQVRKAQGRLEQMARNYDEIRHLTDHARLFGLPQMASHVRRYTRPERTVTVQQAYANRTVRPSMDLREDVRAVVDQIAAAGHDTIVVDQSTPEQHALGLRTVATLSPGLLPIDFGWNRQRALRMPRLRNAFQHAGWRESPLRDDEIVRVPHPFP